MIIFIFIFVFGVVRASHPNINPPREWNGGEYDFIVVGGGTAGCVVAARLAESGSHSVLLVEEGGLPHPDLDIPALGVPHAWDTNYVKIFPSVKQQNAGLVDNGFIEYRTGMTLGGGSAVNGMIFNRGSPYDFNNWADLVRDQSWNYDNMLKYFRKFERYSGNFPNEQRGYHGPIGVGVEKYAPLKDSWLTAGVELGYEVIITNSPQMTGFAEMEGSKLNGRRSSAYSGYIKPLIEFGSDLQGSKLEKNLGGSHHANLHILLNSVVDQLLIEGDRAMGIKMTKNSTTLFAKARKEVILTAGVIGSAVILQKSGIGPKSLLRRAKIPLVRDLPVGRNFHDQMIVTQTIILNNQTEVFIRERDLTPSAFQEYLVTGDGPYASYLGESAQAYIASPYSASPNWPDLHIAPTTFINNTVVLDNAQGLDFDGEGLPASIATILGRPKSRGSISINADNITGTPLIDYQYFTHPDDVRAFASGVKLAAKICEETSSFRRHDCRLPETPFLQCSHFPYKSDQYWECYAMHVGTARMHGVGTCRMGWGPSDPDAVVDPQLRVIGLSGLRVTDGSIMPALVAANTQAAVYAIAEKSAEMILEFWK